MTDKTRWRPISTCPKDGTYFLAWDGNKVHHANQPTDFHYVGYWIKDEKAKKWGGESWGGGYISGLKSWRPMVRTPRRRK